MWRCIALGLALLWASGAGGMPSTPSWDYCPSGYCTNNTTGQHAPTFLSGQAALDDYMSKEPWNGYHGCTFTLMGGTEAQHNRYGRGTGCSGTYTQTGDWFHEHPYGTCPANSTKSGTGTGTVCTCNSGYTESGGSCVQSCPANSTWNGTTCACNPGFATYGGVCAANCPAAGTAGPQVSIPATSSPGGFICYGTCQVQYAEASNQYSVGGVQSWYGKTYYTGSFCSAGDVAGSTQPSQPPSCPAGQVPGTINGQFACLPSSSSSPAQTVSSSSTTTTNASGGTTGSSTTTTTTTDTGTGTTTTTTTTDRDGAGNVTGGSTTTRTVNDKTDKNDVQKFCEDNPNASICKSSTWSGACGGFTCDGDAVQCAIAKEIHTRNCTLFNQSTPQSDLANAIIAGNDPQASQNPALESNRSNFSFTGAISQSPFLPQGGLTDQTIAFSGWSLVIPWSSLNQYLSIMGMIVVAFALVAAARIVMGRA